MSMYFVAVVVLVDKMGVAGEVGPGEVFVHWLCMANVNDVNISACFHDLGVRVGGFVLVALALLCTIISSNVAVGFRCYVNHLTSMR